MYAFSVGNDPRFLTIQLVKSCHTYLSFVLHDVVNHRHHVSSVHFIEQCHVCQVSNHTPKHTHTHVHNTLHMLSMPLLLIHTQRKHQEQDNNHGRHEDAECHSSLKRLRPSPPMVNEEQEDCKQPRGRSDSEPDQSGATYLHVERVFFFLPFGTGHVLARRRCVDVLGRRRRRWNVDFRFHVLKNAVRKKYRGGWIGPRRISVKRTAIISSLFFVVRSFFSFGKRGDR